MFLFIVPLSTPAADSKVTEDIVRTLSGGEGPSTRTVPHTLGILKDLFRILEDCVFVLFCFVFVLLLWDSRHTEISSAVQPDTHAFQSANSYTNISCRFQRTGGNEVEVESTDWLIETFGAFVYLLSIY